MSPRDLAQKLSLFSGMDGEPLDLLIYRLNGVKKEFSKGETVVHGGMEAKRLMAVASGRLHVYEEADDGHRVLVRAIGRDEVLGLWMLNVPEVTCWPGTVVAVEDTVILSLDMHAARGLGETADANAAKFAVNMSRILSKELFTTWRKLTVMDAPTIETRIRTYLSLLDNETGRTGRVTVPFDRERMAEYFGVTRPALSRAIGHLRDQGFLAWRKNIFTIRF